MKFLEKHETELIGNWVNDGKRLVEDEVCIRINWLLLNSLKEITKDESGWDTLYMDPNDKRYWELTYQQSQMHGGGPPSLTNLSIDDVYKKYRIG